MGDVAVVEDRSTVYDDGTVVQVRILSVPESERFPEGVKYAFHYGRTGGDNPIIRFDNHHGNHELHLDERRFVLEEFPGFRTLGRCFRAALPADKRTSWARTDTDSTGGRNA